VVRVRDYLGRVVLINLRDSHERAIQGRLVRVRRDHVLLADAHLVDPAKVELQGDVVILKSALVWMQVV
jgi:hypothetical protein